MMKIQRFRRAGFQRVSQTKISYEASSLSSGKWGKIKAGQRLPYLVLLINNQQQSLFQFVRSKATTPFLFLYFNVQVEEKQSGLISYAEIENNSFNQSLLRKAGFTSSFVLLLRPDNYIGYISRTYDAAKLNEYLHKYLLLV